MPDKYVCTLAEASLKVAKEELHEDPKERLGSVQALREWIIAQPHVTCDTGRSYIIAQPYVMCDTVRFLKFI